MKRRTAPLAMGDDRFRRISQTMRAILVLVGLLALSSALLPEPYSEVLGQMSVAALIAAPLLRVLWMALRWFRRGDYRFGAVALGVFSLAMLGFFLG